MVPLACVYHFADIATPWLKETRAAVENAAPMILLKRLDMFHCMGEYKPRASLPVMQCMVAVHKMEAL